MTTDPNTFYQAMDERNQQLDQGDAPRHPLTDAQVEAVAERVTTVILNTLDEEILDAAALCDVDLPDWEEDEQAAEAASAAIVKAILANLAGDKEG